MKKLVLIDGHAIIHRAYHALPMLTTREGQPVNAVYGFATMILKVIETMQPTHMAVAFDLPVQTFRHETYVAYQSHRPRADDGLRSQVQLVKDLVEAAGIAQYSAPGFEADDVLGTLATLAVQRTKNKGQRGGDFDEVVIVTGDRDILQLVNKRVKVFMPTKGLSEGRTMDEAGVLDYLGVRPDQIIEYKALVGDSSDNYPGVPGVGPKTAIGLIQKHGTVKEIYKKLDVGRQWRASPSAGDGKLDNEVGNERLVQKLRDGREGAEISHKLATIVCDVDIKADFSAMKVVDVAKRKEFLAKLKEFNFRSLYKRMTGDELRVEEQESVRVKEKNQQMGLLDPDSIGVDN